MVNEIEVYGIDLGTTYSAIARVDEYGKPEVIPTIDSESSTPSVILFESADNSVVGLSAKAEALIQPENVVQLVKRHMGDIAWRFEAHGHEWSASDLSALILRKLAGDVERKTGEAASKVVITVPAYFGDEERQATQRAGEIANLNVIDIINEPTAAAYSYGLTRRSTGAVEHVLVYDLGGGTFDVTVIKVDSEALTTIATDGNHHLGGADIDRDLADELSHRIMEDTGTTTSPMDEPQQAQYLLSRAEAAKRQLSDKMSTSVHYVHQGEPGKLTLTQEDLNGLAANVIEQTIELTANVLAAAAAKGVDKIDRLLLVGGQSKMPIIRRKLSERFDLNGELTDPDLAVVRGAALYAAKKHLEQKTKADAVDSGLIRPNQSLNDVSPEDLSDILNNAAENGGLPADEARRMVTTRITNVLSRGVGVFVVKNSSRPDDLSAHFLAHQNEALPLTRESVLYTLSDDQSEAEFAVFEQGGNQESELVDDNDLLGKGVIDKIPRGYPAETPINVLLELTDSGVLKLRAQHPGQPIPMELTLQTSGATRDPKLIAAAKRRVSAVAVSE